MRWERMYSPKEVQISVIRSVAVAFFLRYTLSKRSVFLWVERFMAKGKRAVSVGACFTDSVLDTVLLPHKQFFAAHQYGK